MYAMSRWPILLILTIGTTNCAASGYPHKFTEPSPVRQPAAQDSVRVAAPGTLISSSADVTARSSSPTSKGWRVLATMGYGVAGGIVGAIGGAAAALSGNNAIISLAIPAIGLVAGGGAGYHIGREGDRVRDQVQEAQRSRTEIRGYSTGLKIRLAMGGVLLGTGIGLIVSAVRINFDDNTRPAGWDEQLVQRYLIAGGAIGLALPLPFLFPRHGRMIGLQVQFDPKTHGYRATVAHAW